MGIEINDSNKTIDHEIEKFSRKRFNWPVLLFGYIWFFWKRMYKFGTILFSVSLLTAIFVVMIKLPAFVDSYSFIIKGIGDFEYEVLVWGILLFVPNYIFSLFADNLYVKKLKKQMSTTTVDKSPFYIKRFNNVGLILFSVLLYLLIFFVSLTLLVTIY